MINNIEYMPPARAIELIEKNADRLVAEATRCDREAIFPSDNIGFIRRLNLLGCSISERYGGGGYSLQDICAICEALGKYCASTALIFAMHQSQVAIVAGEVDGGPFFEEYLRKIAREQLLLGSATSEAETDINASYACLYFSGEVFSLTKSCPIISYAEQADAILITGRQSADASPNNQVIALIEAGQFTLEELSTWDAMGFRGTCSSGYKIKSRANIDQLCQAPFASVLRETLLPVSHLLWGSVWIGIAKAVETKVSLYAKGGEYGTEKAFQLKSHLAQLRVILRQMCTSHAKTLIDFNEKKGAATSETVRAYNELKISMSESLVEIAKKGMLACGIEAYRNNSKYSLSRELRDAFGAPLMVSNNRLIRNNIDLQEI